MINNEVTLFWGKKVPVITVWVLKYPFPTQQKLCIQNRNLYIHVQAIPPQKKKNWWQLTNFETPRALGGPLKGHDKKLGIISNILPGT